MSTMPSPGRWRRLDADVSVADGPLFRPEAVAEAFDLMIAPVRTR